MLTHEDFIDLANKAKALDLNDPDGRDRLLATWGFEPEAVRETLIRTVQATATQYDLKYDKKVAGAMMVSCVISFVIACLATMEAEVRRVNDGG